MIDRRVRNPQAPSRSVADGVRDTRKGRGENAPHGARRGRAAADPADACGLGAGCERELAILAAAVAGPDAPLTAAERALAAAGPPPAAQRVEPFRRAMARGDDALGRVFCRLRAAAVRRERGAVYTPLPVVDAMVAWAAGGPPPARIVDPGAGSGRFVLAAAEAFPGAQAVAVEVDPLAALMLRANAAARGLAERVRVLLADYRSIDLPAAGGPTLFLGNPPYVRHHGIPRHWKDWFADAAAACGLKASRLAGLHVHFFLKTLMLARPGDYGTFIASAEWLDVNYGDTMRGLLAGGLGGESLHVIAPAAMPFGDTATTGAIACFRVGRGAEGIRFRPVDGLDRLAPLSGGRTVARSRLREARRWSPFLAPPRAAPRGAFALGDLCRVHRGQVTGCNAVWIAGARSGALPASVLRPAVTRARELFAAAPDLRCADDLRRVIDLPVDLDELTDAERRPVLRFLAWARSMGADMSYVARHRRAWWAVGMRAPAPVLATYMARRPPAFVRNRCGARHINIAHGLYPREPLAEAVLDALAAWLGNTVNTSAGRTYAGGLTKFEPKELERIPIPSPEELHERSEALDDCAGRYVRLGESRRRPGRRTRDLLEPPPPGPCRFHRVDAEPAPVTSARGAASTRPPAAAP